SKVVAKVASDRRKPGGLVVVPPGREASFLAPFDVRLLPGIGPRSEERLRRAGVETIGALAALADEELLAVLPGKVGRLLRGRSTTVRAGVDAAGTIGALACRLLDRALSERPGALRLVGVGVSGLDTFQQLTLV